MSKTSTSANRPRQPTATPPAPPELAAIPESRIIQDNPYDSLAKTNSTGKAPARPAKRNRASTPQERDFEKIFVQAAEAGGWNRRFHVIDQGTNAATRRIIAELRQAGFSKAAGMVARIGQRRVTAKGFPDWSLYHDTHGIIIAELKSDRPGSKATPDQWAWLTWYAKSLEKPGNPYAPSRAHLWRPRHWPAIETQFRLTASPAYCYCDVCEFIRNGQ